MKKTLRTSKLIFLTLILSLLFGCNNSKLSEQEIQIKAVKIIKTLTENDIDILHNWKFEYRGKGEIWTKSSENRNDYRAYYFKEKDSQSFMIFSRYLKSTEYPLLVDIDTSNFKSNIWFYKTGNGEIKVSPSLKVSSESKRIDSFLENELYGSKNPFSDLKKLSDLKDELKIVSVFHNESLGGIIQFYLTYEDVLTYIPNDVNINPIYRQHYLEEFNKGKMIDENWNLRKRNSSK